MRTQLVSIITLIESSILPESPRWLISKRRYNEAEVILRRIATINRRAFDSDAYEKVKEEQERVR